MEGLQGPINPRLFGEEILDVESRETWGVSDHYRHIVDAENNSSMLFQQPPSHYLTCLEDDKTPFLPMLQTQQPPPFQPFSDLLLRLHHHIMPPWNYHNHSHHRKDAISEMSTKYLTIQALDPESCVTHDVPELHSPAKSEAEGHRRYPHSSCEMNQEEGDSVVGPQSCRFSVSPPDHRERRKRKRTKPAKNKEEVESQRMTHIAVERNRRRQMNEHLSALRTLMPSSYVQRGDQASIIGGAINFVKELEQLLESLHAQKIVNNGRATSSATVDGGGESESSPPPKIKPESPNSDEFTAEKNSAAAHVEARVIQNHASLKIECGRRPGQLLKAIIALEELRLTVLHLNITSSETSVQYSFNLKIEDDCKVRSVDEIAEGVHQIFNFINCSS